MNIYNDNFFQYIKNGSSSSAEEIVPIVDRIFKVESILDVGCGIGAWLAIWKKFTTNYAGIDGQYINIKSLLIEEKYFFPHDLTVEFDFKTKFTLVQCLEVAEHLPSESSNTLVKSLCRHSDIILFSAAPPGQGGANHINEKNYTFWQEKFSTNDYLMLDIIRPLTLNNRNVKSWYRYNTFVFIHKKLYQERYSHLENYLVKDMPKDISPIMYRVRKSLIKTLPTRLVTKLAKIKEHMEIYLN